MWHHRNITCSSFSIHMCRPWVQKPITCVSQWEELQRRILCLPTFCQLIFFSQQKSSKNFKWIIAINFSCCFFLTFDVHFFFFFLIFFLFNYCIFAHWILHPFISLKTFFNHWIYTALNPHTMNTTWHSNISALRVCLKC